jgi:hypothetical protein
MAEPSEYELEPFGQSAVRKTRSITEQASISRHGVNAYAVKPVDFHEFVNAIKELGVFWAIINAAPPGTVRK